MATDEERRARAAERKRKSRQRQAGNDGLNRMELILQDNELSALDYLCTHRNPGRQPYARNELIALLIIDSMQRLNKQHSLIPECKNCGSKPPAHCNEAFRGESDCWLTIDCLSLNLGVTGHSGELKEV